MRKPRATTIVLGLLCLMYLITYVDRVNIATAADDIRRDLSLTPLQLGHAFSAFGYSYLLLQVLGGWIGDRFGPRRTLLACGAVWTVATTMTGLAGGLTTLFVMRFVLGLGEGATFPVATRAMQSWLPVGRRGFAQGLTHAFSRFGNAITPPIVAWLIVTVSWRGAFAALGAVSLVWVIAWTTYFRDDPRKHPDITREELDALPAAGATRAIAPSDVPWRALAWRLLPVASVYFCYAWILWLYLNWLPSFFLHVYTLDLRRSALFTSAVFLAGVGGDVSGGVISDRILRRTGNVVAARRGVIVTGFVGSFVFFLPLFFTRDLTAIVLSLASAFFFAELVIGPIWSIPMDIAGRFAGTASGITNSASALAAILSPLAVGYVIDRTGNWQLPFLGSVGILLVGAALSFTMHPERAFDDRR